MTLTITETCWQLIIYDEAYCIAVYLLVRYPLYTSSSSPGATQPVVGVYFTVFCQTLTSSRTRLLDHTQRRATVGRTPLNDQSIAETST
jgi:hypothetical protein